MKSGPAASLRWRSRISKEAVNHDDSSLADAEKGKVVVEDYGLVGENSKTRAGLRSPSTFWSRIYKILAAASSACSVYILEVDMSWFTAVCSSLNIFLSVILVWAVRRLRLLGTVRAQVQYARARVQSLATQNERLYRQLQHLDGLHGRLESVQHELQKLIGANDATRMVTAVQRWRVVQLELHEILRQQVQQEIFKAVLDTDRDGNFVMSAQELERLIVRLKCLPGITLNEDALRLQLEMEDERSVQAILRLVRRIIDDTTVANSNSNVDVEMMLATNKSAIVRLDARALCQQHQREATTKHG